MYTTRTRSGERIAFSGSGRTSAGPYSVAFTTPSVVEGVYSWRTGRHVVSDPGVSSQLGYGNWGVKAPSNRGNLVDRLADRKRYLEETARAAFPAETQTGSVSTNRSSKTDSGHLFASHKTFRMPFHAVANIVQPGGYGYDGDLYGSLDRGLNNPSPYPLLLGEITTNFVGVSSLVRQGMANRYFAATAPDRPGATLATTLIELLRGDIPSVLKNFQNMMAGYRSVKNYAGSEALNIMFGWTPLIQEYANVIKVGMALERVIYYESFRRQRSWDGPSTNGSSNATTSLSSTLGAYPGFSNMEQSGEVLGPTTGHGAVFLDTRQEWVASENYYFSSRYTGIAKASRKAESFSDQAFDVVKRLGLVDDPAMLWNLTPYSWLLDWFVTMGDSITNANVYSPMRGKYNVDYAYLTTVNTYAHKAYLGTMRPVSGLSCSVKRGEAFSTSVTKWRDRATPFGFGTQLGSLSASQFGILVALGLAQLN